MVSLLGITNYEEYSLIQEQGEEKKEDGMGTLKKERTLLRDERKMEKLKAKLHTDDECKFVFNLLYVYVKTFIKDTKGTKFHLVLWFMVSSQNQRENFFFNVVQKNV